MKHSTFKKIIAFLLIGIICFPTNLSFADNKNMSSVFSQTMSYASADKEVNPQDSSKIDITLKNEVDSSNKLSYTLLENFDDFSNKVNLEKSYLSSSVDYVFDLKLGNIKESYEAKILFTNPLLSIEELSDEEKDNYKNVFEDRFKNSSLYLISNDNIQEISFEINKSDLSITFEAPEFGTFGFISTPIAENPIEEIKEEEQEIVEDKGTLDESVSEPLLMSNSLTKDTIDLTTETLKLKSALPNGVVSTEFPVTVDNMTIEKAQIKWLTNNAGTEPLTMVDELLDMQWQLDVAFSGKGYYNPGDVEIILPAYIWKTRDDIEPSYITLGISEDNGEATGEFAWKRVEDTIVITNIKKISASTKVMIQGTYRAKNKGIIGAREMFDIDTVNPDAAYHGVSDDLYAVINVITPFNEVLLTGTTNPIIGQIDTQAKVTSASKKPIQQQNGNVITDKVYVNGVPSSLPTELLPENPNDYYYVEWYVDGNVYYSQPYTMTYSDTLLDEYGGILLGATDRRGNNTKAVNGVLDNFTQHYVWSAYPKTSFELENHIYSVKNQVAVTVTGADDLVSSTMNTVATASFKNPITWKIQKVWEYNEDKYDSTLEFRKEVQPDQTPVWLMPSNVGSIIPSYTNPVNVHADILSDSNNWYTEWTDDGRTSDYTAWEYNRDITKSTHGINGVSVSIVGGPLGDRVYLPNGSSYQKKWWYDHHKTEYDNANHTWTFYNDYHEGIDWTYPTFYEKSAINHTNNIVRAATDKDLVLLKDGNNSTELIYSVKRVLPVISYTMKENGNEYNPENLKQNTVRLEMVDHTEYFEDRELHQDEYHISFVELVKSESEDWVPESNLMGHFTSAYRLETKIYGLVNNEWIHFATFNTSNNATTFNGATINGKKVSFNNEDVKQVKAVSYTNGGIVYMTYNLGVVLHPSEQILSRINSLFEVSDYIMAKSKNTATTTLYKENTEDILDSVTASATTYLHGRNYRLAVDLDKNVSTLTNNVNKKYFRSTNTITLNRVSNIAVKSEFLNAVSEGLLPDSKSGVFYDLLPAGMQADLTTLKITNGEIKTFDIIENYQNSGRQLVIVEVDLNNSPTIPSITEAKRKDATYPRYYEEQVYGWEPVKLSFDMIYTWEEARNRGVSNLRNTAAYMADEEVFGNARYWSGEKDAPTGENHKETLYEVLENVRDLLTDLNEKPDTPNTVYAGADVPVGINDFSAITDLRKQVALSGSDNWSFGEDNDVNVAENGKYTYKITLTSGSDTTTKNIILLDAFENYTPVMITSQGDSDITVGTVISQGEFDDTNEYLSYSGGALMEGIPQNGWKGSFNGIDISEITAMGVDAKIYYSVKENIDISNYNTGNSANSNVVPQILTESGDWSLTPPSNLSTVTAIAIDCRKDENGNDFELNEHEGLIAYVHMIAPNHDTDPQIFDETDYMNPNKNVKAYNNVYMDVTQIDAVGGETHSYNHFDFTTVGIYSSKLVVNKVWDDDNNNDRIRPESIDVELYSNGEPTGKTATLTKDSWNAEFPFLPVNDTDGKPILYTIKETQEITDYTSSSTQKVENGIINVTLTNKHENYKTSVPFTKTWTSNEPGDWTVFIPNRIKVSLYRNGVYTGINKYVTRNADGSWHGEFTDLQKFNQGELINYSVEEVPIQDWRVTYDGNNITNEYYPKGDLTVEKQVINGTDVALNNSFTFNLTLTEPDESPCTELFDYEIIDISSQETIESGKIGHGDTFSLKHNQRIIIHDILTRVTYKVTEEVKSGFTLSYQSNATGKVNSQNETNALFKNTYVTSGSVPIEGTKNLTGREMTRGQFRFELYDSNNQLIRVAPNQVDKTFTFGNINFTNKDNGITYTYIIKEVNRNRPGYTYDESVYEVDLTPHDNGNGTMTIDKQYYKIVDEERTPVSSLEFNNEYHATGEVVLKAWKLLEGRNLQGGEFTFNLIDESGVIIDTKNNSLDGSVIFDKLQFNEGDIGKTYYYTIKEKTPTSTWMGDPTVIYDETTHGYSIYVVDNGDGTLHFVQNSINPNGLYVLDDITFNNNQIFGYDPGISYIMKNGSGDIGIYGNNYLNGLDPTSEEYKDLQIIEYLDEAEEVGISYSGKIFIPHFLNVPMTQENLTNYSFSGKLGIIPTEQHADGYYFDNAYQEVEGTTSYHNTIRELMEEICYDSEKWGGFDGFITYMEGVISYDVHYPSGETVRVEYDVLFDKRYLGQYVLPGGSGDPAQDWLFREDYGYAHQPGLSNAVKVFFYEDFYEENPQVHRGNFVDVEDIFSTNVIEMTHLEDLYDQLKGVFVLQGYYTIETYNYPYNDDGSSISDVLSQVLKFDGILSTKYSYQDRDLFYNINYEKTHIDDTENELNSKTITTKTLFNNPTYVPVQGEIPVFKNSLKDGSLSISKYIENSNDVNTEFNFKLKLFTDNYEDIEIEPGTVTQSSTGIRGVEYEITLRPNQVAIFNNIPAGTIYQVYEETKEGWVLVQQENTSGSIEPLQTKEAKFTNKYQPEITVAQFNGIKTLDNRGASEGSFQFRLSENDIEMETVSVKEGGFIQFSPIEYDSTMIGEHIYTIEEINPENDDLDWDTHKEIIKVTVTNNEGVLGHTVEYDSDGIAFKNMTRPGTLQIKKEVDLVTDANQDDEFTVKITFNNENGVPLSFNENIYYYLLNKDGEIINNSSLLNRVFSTLSGRNPALKKTEILSLSTPYNNEELNNDESIEEQPVQTSDFLNNLIQDRKGLMNKLTNTNRNSLSNFPEEFIATPEMLEGTAYAVLTDEGDFILFRSTDNFEHTSSNFRGTLTDIKGNTYTGVIWRNVENIYQDVSNTDSYTSSAGTRYQQSGWATNSTEGISTYSPLIKTISIAEGQAIKPKYTTTFSFKGLKNVTNVDLSRMDLSGLSFSDNYPGIQILVNSNKNLTTSSISVPKYTLLGSVAVRIEQNTDGTENWIYFRTFALPTTSSIRDVPDITGYTHGDNVRFFQEWNTPSISNVKNIIFSEGMNFYEKVLLGGAKLENISGLNNLNTDNWTTMSNLFRGCSALKTLDLGTFNTEKVTDMSYMFYDCSSLELLNITSFNTQNVTRMNSMFSNCQSLELLDLSSFDFSNVYDMAYFMSGCGVEEFDFSILNLNNTIFEGWNTSSSTNASYPAIKEAFFGLYNLKGADLRVLDSYNDRARGLFMYIFNPFYDTSKIKVLPDGTHTYNSLEKFIIGDKPVNGFRSFYVDERVPGFLTNSWVNQDTNEIIYSVKGENNTYTLNKPFTKGTYYRMSRGIYFDTNGGYGEIDPISIVFSNEKIALPTNITRPGYTLLGWEREKDGPVYIPLHATMEFMQTNEGSRGSNTDGIIKETGVEVTIYSSNSYNVNTYNYNGISNLSDFGAGRPDKGKVQLYAVWEYDGKNNITVNHYQQNINDTGYSLVDTDIIHELPGTEVSTNIKQYEGFHTTAVSETLIMPELDTEPTIINYYYDRDVYNVKFDGNGSTSGQMLETLNMVGGISNNLPKNSYSKEGSIFNGWNTKQDGTGVSYTDGQSVVNIGNHGETITLYAQWLENNNVTVPSEGVVYIKLRAGETIVIPDLPAGTTYKIEEVNIPSGWEYKNGTNEQGIIEPNTVSNSSITNTYKANGFIYLEAHKNLVGDTVQNNQFSFELLNSSNQVIETSSNGELDIRDQIVNDNGDVISNPWENTAPIQFGPLEFTEQDIGKSFTYTIREINSGDPTIIYDTHTERVTVKVKDNGSGMLVADITYDSDGPLFTNTKQSGTLTLSKNIINATESAEDTIFNFRVVLKDSFGNDLTGTYPVKIKHEDYNITHLEETKYSHTLNIDDEGNRTGGFGINQRLKDVVTIPGATKLHIDVRYGTYGGATSYARLYVIPGEYTGIISTGTPTGTVGFLFGYTTPYRTASYDIEGDTVTFGFYSGSYTSYNNNATAAYGYGYYAIITANEDIETGFDTTTITNEGILSMKSSDTIEISGLPHGATYEIVELDSPGWENTNSSNSTGTIEAGENKDVLFENTYSTLGEFNPILTKEFYGGSLEDNTFNFVLTDENENVLSTGTTDSNGNIEFIPIYYTQEDDGKRFIYYVKEIPDDTENIVWDEHLVEYIVDVQDNGQGILNVNVETDENTLTFINSKVTDISITKQVDGNLGNKQEEFEFTLNLDGDWDKSKITYEKINSNGEKETGEVNNSEFTFTLSHNDTIKFNGIVCGTEYTIIENTGGNYNTRIQSNLIEDTISGKQISNTLTESEEIIFTNTLNSVVPTEIRYKNNVITISILLSMIIVFIFVKKYRYAKVRKENQ